MNDQRSQPVSFIDDISAVTYLLKSDRNALAYFFKQYFSPLMAFAMTYTRNKPQTPLACKNPALSWEPATMVSRLFLAIPTR